MCAFFLPPAPGKTPQDFVVVALSITAMAVPTLPGLSLLRLVRVVRVVKLFKQMQSLKIILESMISAILPVANAFVVLLIFASLFAVMAVMFFKVSYNRMCSLTIECVLLQ